MTNREKPDDDAARRLTDRLVAIYGPDAGQKAAERLLSRLPEADRDTGATTEKWNERDVVLITYGDSMTSDTENALQVLHRWVRTHLDECITCVHVLPFFPYSSDDGFSVIDYRQVDPALGTWADIRQIGEDYDVMVDLVINHASKECAWFRNFLADQDPGRDYFITVDPDTDLSAVVRPRSLPLLTPFETSTGLKHVWTTFSDDQVDLNVANPDVLLEMIDILLLYMRHGARIVRLDAIAFLWKQPGTTCLHLRQTHDIVKVLRDVMERVDHRAVLLTETNVPNRENLSYFGAGDEAHMVYQFSLPPLLLHALYTGCAGHLSRWAADMPELEPECTFLNFTASHDGIGVRPLEGLLEPDELTELLEGMQACGGRISTRHMNDGTDRPYEINISWFDAMQRTARGPDRFTFERFILSQVIMLEMRGIPAFYIHSLVATRNHEAGVAASGRARTINRRKWTERELEERLQDHTTHRRALAELKRLIALRKAQKAFHPDAEQTVMFLDEACFAIRRTSRDGDQHIQCLSNVTANVLDLDTRPGTVLETSVDLISGEHVAKDGRIRLRPYQTVWLTV